MTVVTPTVRTSLKRTAFWSIGSVVAVLIAIVLLLVRGVSGPGGVFLSATNPAPGGAMAVAEVLRDRGVTVEVVDTQRDAKAALDGTDATLLFHDADAYLEPDRLDGIVSLAAHTVIVEPDFATLREVVPEVSAAGAVEGVLKADCAIPAVSNAGTVLGDGSGYRLTTESAGAVTCLGSGDDVHSLIQVAHDDHTVTVLGASAALTNEHVAKNGNAALALTLLGEHDTLVWYQPTLADVAGGSATIADLTPEWVSPALALMFLVVIAAGVWRGRRLGPLAVEHLPVTVPANETMDGRARLYQKASARLRALDALRVGTVSRLAVVCGLPPSASVAEVAAFTASVTGRNLHEVRRLLLEAEPATDRELITLSDDLLTLEKAAVRSATGGDHRRAAGPTTDPGE
jgi:hypothetical protein